MAELRGDPNVTGRMAEILDVLGRAPRTAENLNRAQIKLLHTQDSTTDPFDMTGRVDAVAEGRQYSPRTQQGNPTARVARTSGGGQVAATTSPATVATPPKPPADPGRGPTTPPAPASAADPTPTAAPLPVANNPALPANRIGRAISNPNADAPASDPYQPQQRPQIGGADVSGDFDPAAVIGNNPSEPSTIPTTDVRAPLRDLSAGLHNYERGADRGTDALLATVLGIGGGGNPFRALPSFPKPRISVTAGSRPSETAQPTPAPVVSPSPATAAPSPSTSAVPMPRNVVQPVEPRGLSAYQGPSAPRPVEVNLPTGGRVPGPVQPQPNPIQYTPGRPVAPDVPNGVSEQVARILSNERPPAPSTIPAAPARPMGTQPAPVPAPTPLAPREIPITPTAPPRAGPDAATQFAGMPPALAPPRPPATPPRGVARGRQRGRTGMGTNKPRSSD